MSVSRPIRRSGAEAAIASPNVSSVAAIIFDGERSRCDGVDGDVLRTKLFGQHSGQLVDRSLARRVGVGGHRADVDTVDAADVDDSGGSSWVPARRSAGSSSCTIQNGDFTLRSSTRSQAVAGSSPRAHPRSRRHC